MSELGAQSRVLVIGATGNVGREVVSALLAAGSQVRGMMRSRDVSNLPPQVEAVYGDLSAPETLDTCLDQIDAAFLIWVAPPAAAAPALERITQQVRRLVFLSSPYKTAHPFFQQPNAMRGLHAHIEQIIERSGCEWTFLRPGMFASNARMWWAHQVRAGDVVRWPYAAAQTAPIHERNIADVAVRALLENGHAGAEYVLTGPRSITQAEQVATIATVLGRPLRYEEISPEAARRELLAIMPLSIINMLLDAWGAALGQPAFLTTTVEKLLGRPALSFESWVREHVVGFT